MLTQELLLKEYGHNPRRHRDPLDTLIFTILSQNTTDTNRDRAAKTLKERFPSWEEVRDAEVGEIVEIIKSAGLAQIRASRIKEVLEMITFRRGELDLSFLGEMENEEAKEWLTSLRGVGPKTAACVLLFSFGKPVLPVDTHVLRVSKRLGLIPSKTSAEKAHILLEEMVPAEAIHDFHLNMIAHGRNICQAQRPRCERCILAHICDYMRAFGREPVTIDLNANQGGRS